MGRNSGEHGASPDSVIGDLRLQLVDTGEFPLRPDEIDEGDAQMASVEVDVGIKEVRLETRHQASDGRAKTDIGDPVDGATGERIVGTVAGNPYGIDPEGRVQIVVEPEVGGRKADRPAAPVAGRDTAVDFPVSAEKRRRLTRGFPAFNNSRIWVDE